jgi:putative sterol carrier protein
MGFPYKDPEQAEAFLLGFIERLKDVEEIYKGWSALNMVIGIHLKQPDVDFWVDTRGGDVVVCKEQPGPEGASLTLTADLFHQLYTGRENVMLAFVKGKIKPRGKVAGIMQLTRTMPSAVEVYKAYLAKKGLAS